MTQPTYQADQALNLRLNGYIQAIKVAYMLDFERDMQAHGATDVTYSIGSGNGNTGDLNFGFTKVTFAYLGEVFQIVFSIRGVSLSPTHKGAQVHDWFSNSVAGMFKKLNYYLDVK